MIFYCKKFLGGVRNSSPALAGSPSLLLRSANRWICGSLSLAQISPYGETSHTRQPLSEIRLGDFKNLSVR